MAKIAQISAEHPLTFYPMVTKVSDDPHLEALAEQLENPRLVLCDFPLEGNPCLEVSDLQQVEKLLNWLAGDTRWGSVIESTLQSLSEDAQGRPLLSAFMTVSEFADLAAEPDAGTLVPGLAAACASWGALGATNIYFEGYKATATT